jgi:hypothetical protein
MTRFFTTKIRWRISDAVQVDCDKGNLLKKIQFIL